MKQATLVILILFINAKAYSQVIPFKNYTVKEGLPSNYVSDIVQDKKGYIWFATDIGLVKFDGYNFNTFSIDQGLSDNYIKSITVDKENRIWAGTEIGGISVVDGVNVFNIKPEDGLFSEPVQYIFADSSDNIWACAVEDGISIINKDTIQTYNSTNSILQSNIYCYNVDSRGIVWLGNYDGIYYYDSVLNKINHPLLDTLIVWDIIGGSDGKMWIASQDNGVFCYRNDSVFQYNVSNGMTTNTALSLIEDDKKRIVVGTYDGGINIIQEGKVITTMSEQTRDYSIWQLLKDTRGRIWGRTLENGVVLIEKTEIYNYTEENSIVSNYLLGLYEDDQGNIWFITEGGVSKFGKVFFEIYQDNFVWEDKHILSVYMSEEKELFAGSYSGLTIFGSDMEVKQYSDNEGLSDKPTVGAILSYNNRIWLGTYGLISFLREGSVSTYVKSFEKDDFEIYAKSLIGVENQIYGATDNGLLQVDLTSKDYKIYTESDGLINNNLYCLAKDFEGNIWCGTADGLSVFDGNKFHNFNIHDGLPNNFCNDISFDDKGVAWIVTDNGLCSAVLSENYVLSTKNYHGKYGFSSNTMFSVLPDSDNIIWVGHNKGVSKLDLNSKKVKNYGFQEGFLPIENNSGAITKDDAGNIWFGTIDGIVKYSPKYDNINNTAPKVYIKDIKLYNDTASIEKYYTAADPSTALPVDLNLSHKKKNLYFEYVGLHYSIVEKNKYKYRLLGYDDKWSEETTETQSIPYQKLPNGRYTFQVMAANCDGVWTKEPAEFSFRILPPWWKTWWARVLEIAFIAGVFLLVINLRERKLKHDKKVLTQKVKERTAEVVKQKDQIEEQKDEILRQKQEITDSIKYAEHIQSAILPKDNTISTMLNDYFILFKPRDIVSGDFYWIDQVNGKVVAIAADCTGHGVPGAFMSILGVSILNQLAAGKSEMSAHDFLNQLREKIISTLSHTRKDEEARDGMDIALCILDPESNSVEFSGAYNPLIIIRNGEPEVYKPNKMPVGAMPGELKPFTSQEIALEKGDCLYMFSDGYADQFGGEDGKKFKSAPFRRLLCEISSKPMEEQKQILDSTIESWMANEEQIDDILVMGIRV